MLVGVAGKGVKHRRRNHMHSSESQLELTGRWHKPFRTRLAGGDVLPALQTPAGVKHEVARRGALGYEHRGVGGMVEMIVVEVGKIEVGHDVGVMHEERLAVVEQRASLQDASAGVEQLAALVAHLDVDPEVAVVAQKVDNLLPEVMDVDHNVGEAV